MQKPIGKKIQIIHGKVQSAPLTSVGQKAPALFGLFARAGGEPRRSAAASVLKGPSFKESSRPVSRRDLDAVKSWVGLEEKIVHDYKAKKIVPVKSGPSLPTLPSKPSPEAFETFSTQTTVSFASTLPGIKRSVRIAPRSSGGLGRLLSVLVWFAACAFVFVYVQGILSNREASRQLEQIQSDKLKLEQSYAELQSVSTRQAAEMRRMDRQIRDGASALRMEQDQKDVFTRGVEKEYREELMQITIRYEAELDALRGAVRTKDAIVLALRAQMKAFEKLIDPASIAAVSGGASSFSRSPFSGPGNSGQGSILSVNWRQGFVVIDLGSERGVHSGHPVVISRDGVVLTTGRVDRVYPSMSAVLVHDAEVAPRLREGDTVSFS